MQGQTWQQYSRTQAVLKFLSLVVGECWGGWGGMMCGYESILLSLMVIMLPHIWG